MYYIQEGRRRGWAVLSSTPGVTYDEPRVLILVQVPRGGMCENSGGVGGGGRPGGPGPRPRRRRGIAPRGGGRGGRAVRPETTHRPWRGRSGTAFCIHEPLVGLGLPLPRPRTLEDDCVPSGPGAGLPPPPNEPEAQERISLSIVFEFDHTLSAAARCVSTRSASPLMATDGLREIIPLIGHRLCEFAAASEG